VYVQSRQWITHWLVFLATTTISPQQQQQLQQLVVVVCDIVVVRDVQCGPDDVSWSALWWAGDECDGALSTGLH